MFFNCNKSKIDKHNLSLFHFPKNDPTRAQEWVKNQVSSVLVYRGDWGTFEHGAHLNIYNIVYKYKI